MFEQAFKNVDDVLWKEAGCTTELDYTEQTSWLLFLKYLDGLEQDKATEARLEGKMYSFILDAPFRWESWAAPKGPDGKLDHNQALTGDDLRYFADCQLFLYLHGFKQRASGPNTIEYKIGERIYDSAVGSAGLLCEAYEYLKASKQLTTSDRKALQESTFYGIEKKSLAYVIAIMTMILLGIETPNIVHANTLALNLADVQDKDRFDLILANPPFGGKERKEVQ